MVEQLDARPGDPGVRLRSPARVPSAGCGPWPDAASGAWTLPLAAVDEALTLPDRQPFLDRLDRRTGSRRTPPRDAARPSRSPPPPRRSARRRAVDDRHRRARPPSRLDGDLLEHGGRHLRVGLVLELAPRGRRRRGCGHGRRRSTTAPRPGAATAAPAPRRRSVHRQAVVAPPLTGGRKRDVVAVGERARPRRRTRRCAPRARRGGAASRPGNRSVIACPRVGDGGAVGSSSSHRSVASSRSEAKERTSTRIGGSDRHAGQVARCWHRRSSRP